MSSSAKHHGCLVRAHVLLCAFPDEPRRCAGGGSGITSSKRGEIGDQNLGRDPGYSLRPRAAFLPGTQVEGLVSGVETHSNERPPLTRHVEDMPRGMALSPIECRNGERGFQRRTA